MLNMLRFGKYYQRLLVEAHFGATLAINAERGIGIDNDFGLC